MSAQGNKRFTAEELEHARTDNERERALHDLTQVLPAPELEQVLRSLGGPETRLAGLPPLSAAVRFVDTGLEHTRAKRLSAADVHAAAATVAAGRGQPDVPAPQPLFERAIFVFGLRRGANHAISEWLRGHFDEAEVCYLNSAEISLFETEGNTLTVDRDTYRRLPVDPGKRVLIVGYENLDPAHFPLRHNARVARRSDVVVVLRDFPNTAASIARQADDDPAFAYRYRIRDLLDLWKRYADYFARRAFGHTYIAFNSWFSDPDERRAISRRLGLDHTDEGLNRVSPYGEGSSFDGLHHDGRAQDMAVLGRWESMLDDRLFQFLLLADEEALEADQRLFGGFPHTRADLLRRWRAGGDAR
ncbi:hypothetical protein [Streptomyces sp. GSL17-111]|uniref:hypothetical protein n=1 Tax=Streptomyces sp. GSL17-111 TaxID=3121596 RepID=UPI0030F3F174